MTPGANQDGWRGSGTAMTERQKLDRAKIEKAFRIMGQYLRD
jgi:hypothetical protein